MSSTKPGKPKRQKMSVWAVNQLWLHARDVFDDLLATAEKLRKGDLRASASHREALGKLRQRAAAFLQDKGHSPNESVLRAVTQSLSSIAASGWGDDAPGELSLDREPPGFGVPGLEVGERVVREAAKRDDGEAKRRAAAEKQRLEAALRTAKGDVRAKHHEVTRLEKELEKAQREVERAQSIVDDLERELKAR